MELPRTRAQLWRLPLAGVLLGGLWGLGAAPLFGTPVALVAAGALGAALAALTARVAWRSRFGPRAWLAGAVAFTAVLQALVLLLAAGAVLVLGADAAAGRTLAAFGTLALAGAVGLSALVERRRLADRGGAWWQAVVDTPRRRVGSPWVETAPAGGAERLGVLAAAIGVNVPLALELLGYRQSQWFPWLAAALGAAVLHVGWHAAGRLLGRALAVMAVERETGGPFEHRDIAALDALRRGEAPPVEGDGPPRPLRWLRGTLQALAGVGIVGGLTLAFAAAWPAWQQSRDWAQFQRVAVLVTAVELTAQRGDWVGQGTVDGLPVDFRPGELNALLGPPPTGRPEALAAVRGRLPLRAEAWWNPAVAQRLLPPQTTADAVHANARHAIGFTLALFAAGGVALLLDMPLRRRAQQAPTARPRRRGGTR